MLSLPLNEENLSFEIMYQKLKKSILFSILLTLDTANLCLIALDSVQRVSCRARLNSGEAQTFSLSHFCEPYGAASVALM